MGRVTVRHPITRFADGTATKRIDTLAAEEPLEIRLAGEPLTVTMRTPGDDFDLVTGFLLAEGVITEAADLRDLRYCTAGDDNYNVVDVRLAPHILAPDVTRNFPTTSACGVCGKASIGDLAKRARWDVADDPVHLDPAVLAALPDTLRQAQKVFSRTGGLHAAGLFSAAGELRCLREDVGRHNAVDKVVGHSVREGLLPLRGQVLLVSGRASFELTQKAWMAGIPALAAVSAPSSLAVSLAAEAGLTLIGFLRSPTMNVYTRPDRCQ
ncbi:MAG: formate dehydrogenase accessory sulfurtransferase FdhD [Streptosporangiaceae bacterium]